MGWASCPPLAKNSLAPTSVVSTLRMRKMDVIPAIDLLEGRCVRLYQGDYEKSQVFSENPADEIKDVYNNARSPKKRVIHLDKEGQLLRQAIDRLEDF